MFQNIENYSSKRGVKLYIVLKVFFDPNTIHKTKLFVLSKEQKAPLNSEKQFCGVAVTEFAFAFQTNDSPLYQSHNLALQYKLITKLFEKIS